MKHLTLVFLFVVGVALPMVAQRHEMLSDNIASLQVVVNYNWTALPVITLNSDDVIHVDFDELSHNYHRYCYKIEHCEADWSVSDGLLDGDFVNGFASGNTIDDWEESVNTNQLYTHYSLRILMRNAG